jgi:hypothetical protein
MRRPVSETIEIVRLAMESGERVRYTLKHREPSPRGCILAEKPKVKATRLALEGSPGGIMADSSTGFNASQAAIILLNDYRQRRHEFRVYDDYDQAMKQMRESASGKIEALGEPLKSIASRLFSIADQGFFLFQVCEWKIDFIAEALIHSIEAKNPIALANNTRALIEHLAALVAIVKELNKLLAKLRGQGQEISIRSALEKTEIFIYRSYYGKSSKLANEPHEQALHVNELIKTLKDEVPDIEDVYDFLCEYVHPNHDSNALVSTGRLANGRLNPPEEYHQETLDRLRGYCSLSMLLLKKRGIEHVSTFIKLQNLVDLCSARGATVNNVFAIKKPIPDGDGKSKETAYFFRKARTAAEAIDLSHEFIEVEGYDVKRKEIGGLGDGVIFDVYHTDKGTIALDTGPAELPEAIQGCR